jgi:hypothetical protein
MEHERLIGRFVLAGEEIERDWIGNVVTALTNCARSTQENPSAIEELGKFYIPEFSSQFEEIKWWASKEGLHLLYVLMCVAPHDPDDPEDDPKKCQFCVNKNVH